MSKILISNLSFSAFNYLPLPLPHYPVPMPPFLSIAHLFKQLKCLFEVEKCRI